MELEKIYRLNNNDFIETKEYINKNEITKIEMINQNYAYAYTKVNYLGFIVVLLVLSFPPIGFIYGILYLNLLITLWIIFIIIESIGWLFFIFAAIYDKTFFRRKYIIKMEE